nr:unnamed protein product [Spirometra erinaceieuropaei]
MYDTRRRKALFEQINNRSWEALRPVIRKWVAGGSIIVTDEWKGYTRLPSEGYTHYTVNHRRGLVNPTTGRHTNAIEAYWSRLKRKLQESGPVCGRAVWARLDEVQYRLWFDLRTDNMAASWETFLRHWAAVLPTVNVAVTGRLKRGMAIEEGQPSTNGDANQRRRRRKAGSACSRYWPVIEGAVGCGEPTMDDWGSQPMKARMEDWKV